MEEKIFNEANDKLTFVIPRKARKQLKDAHPTIRISSDAYNLIEGISARTGFSNAYVASRMVEYAAKRTEVVTHYSDSVRDNTIDNEDDFKDPVGFIRSARECVSEAARLVDELINELDSADAGYSEEGL